MIEFKDILLYLGLLIACILAIGVLFSVPWSGILVMVATLIAVYVLLMCIFVSPHK